MRDVGTDTAQVRALLADEFLGELLRVACTSAQWAADGQTPASTRLERAFGKLRLRIADAERIEIEIQLRLDPALVIRARVAQSWTERTHDAIFRRLEQHARTPLVRLALIHWAEISEVCARSAAAWELSAAPSCEERVLDL